MICLMGSYCCTTSINSNTVATGVHISREVFVQQLKPIAWLLYRPQGANQAAAAAKLGYPTYFVGNVGDDSYADPLRDALQSAGVKLDYVKSVPGPTGTAVILLQHSGQSMCLAHISNEPT